jgi:hypothetical protein
MPITISFTPPAPAFSMIVSSAGIMLSPPSPENRFWPT